MIISCTVCVWEGLQENCQEGEKGRECLGSRDREQGREQGEGVGTGSWGREQGEGAGTGSREKEQGQGTGSSRDSEQEEGAG